MLPLTLFFWVIPERLWYIFMALSYSRFFCDLLFLSAGCASRAALINVLCFTTLLVGQIHLVYLKDLALVSFNQINRQWSIRATLMLYASFRLPSLSIWPKRSNVRQSKMLILRQKKCRRISADEFLTPSGECERKDRNVNRTL